MTFHFGIFFVHGVIVDLSICLSIVIEVVAFFRFSYVYNLSTLEQKLAIASLPDFLCLLTSRKHNADRNLKDLYGAP